MKKFLFCLLMTGVVAVATDDKKTVAASDLDALRNLEGQAAVVTGTVVDIGTTKDNDITFINIDNPRKQGFVAVVFKRNYDAFPDGFTAYKGKKVQVSGTIEIFKTTNMPQIVVKSPSQITIVEEK